MGFNSERGDAERCERRRDEENEGDREEVLGGGG